MDWSVELTVSGIVLAVVGLALTYWVFWRGGGRGTLVTVSLLQEMRIDSDSLGADVAFLVGRGRRSNLVILDVGVCNRGPKALYAPGGGDPNDPKTRPRIELPERLRIIVDPWTTSNFTDHNDVRASRHIEEANGRQYLSLHIRKLAKGEQASIRVLCTDVSKEPGRDLTGAELGWHPGFMLDATAVGAGLLSGRTPQSHPAPSQDPRRGKPTATHANLRGSSGRPSPSEGS